MIYANAVGSVKLYPNPVFMRVCIKVKFQQVLNQSGNWRFYGIMTPKDRCIAAIELEEPDRIPLVLRIRPEPFQGLKTYLDAGDDEEVYRILGVDVRATGIGLKGGYEAEGAPCEEGGHFVGKREGYEVVRDIFGFETIWAPSHTYTYTFVSHPLQRMSLEDYRWPEPDESKLPNVEKFCENRRDYCIYGGIAHMFEIAWKLTGFPEFMLRMYREPGFVEAILDKLNAIRTAQAVLLAEAGVDVIVDGDDIGAQAGLMMSPKHWRRFLKHRYKDMIERVKKQGDIHVLFHSDGYIEPIIPDLIEVGVDILNPVQPECMNPVMVKELYGDRLCLDGTLGIQSTLPFGTVQDIINEVKQRIAALGPTGLILGPTHSMQQDVSPEKVVALYDTVKKHGWNTRRSS